MPPMTDATAADCLGLETSPPLASTTREWDDDADDGGGDDATTRGRRLSRALSLEPGGSSRRQRGALDSFAAVPETEWQDADVLGFSPRRQRRQHSFGAARQLGDLLPDDERAELNAGVRDAASPAQHSTWFGSVESGSAAAFVAELQHRQDAAEGVTPSRRANPRQDAASFGGNSQEFVPESPLASSLRLAERDERAELVAALKRHSPGAASRSRCLGGKFFGKFAFKGAANQAQSLA